MYKGIKLSASLMCIDWMNAGAQLDALEKLNIDYLHIDVLDGNFAQDFTMGSSIINTFRKGCHLPFDYHLMVEEPNHFIDVFPVTTHDIYTIHQEGNHNLHRDLMQNKVMGVRVGVALAPATSLDTLEYIMNDIDVVVVMTVDPGFKGRMIVPQVIRKIEKLNEMIQALKLNVEISVDGCVNSTTIPLMIEAGANLLVLGSSGLFRENCSLQDSIKEIHHAIDLGLKKLHKDS